ncbi:hypothetical protein TEA_019226 [Camellia sinensis var. sinensis]|uniref:RING-type domain-containing protein n=1 Tax=Camellia sinensis var. sinensis TaxID=542762 RepID=A0A4S4E596_CAMSN|nr:hypothetical protein TEA_019226 [Camellia sinensis var. sinensis]
MEASAGNSDAYRDSSMSSSSSRRHGMQFSVLNFLNSPLSTLLEYSGILRTRSSHPESGRLINSGVSVGFQDHVNNDSAVPANGGEVAIRIIGAGEQDHDRSGTVLPSSTLAQMREVTAENQVYVQPIGRTASATSVSSALDGQGDSRSDRGAGESVSQSLNGGGVDGAGANSRDSLYQRYDIQQAARWIEHILPFSLLLLVIFIRQHLQGMPLKKELVKMQVPLRKGMTRHLDSSLQATNPLGSNYSLHWARRRAELSQVRQGTEPRLKSCLIRRGGFFVTIWIAAVMFKSNEFLRKQTALKGERKISVLVGISFVFMLHVIGVYWWYRNDDLLALTIPRSKHVIKVAMVLKCILLMYYKNSRGRNYRKQGQMLTLVEYLLLLYRALLPAPVWYRFFLNKEYGSLFSSLMTGLYLTFKLTSVVEKVQSFFAALKALSHKEIHYGAHATSEQVSAAGDLCAICQEKMHTPILLRCKHIFCEDCVLEWFERERTCPLCRALVKPADLRSFGDGSTSLFFQLF